MLLAKVKDLLLNRRNKYEIESFATTDDFIDGEELVLWAMSMARTLSIYDGKLISSKPLHIEGIVVTDDAYGDGNIKINNLSKITDLEGDPLLPSLMTELTHSFSELDETLQEIIEEAFMDNGILGVACSQAQWNAIKSLLDKSLYLNYAGWSVIKSATNGIDNYSFGDTSGATSGYKITLWYNDNLQLVFAALEEM